MSWTSNVRQRRRHDPVVRAGFDRPPEAGGRTGGDAQDHARDPVDHRGPGGAARGPLSMFHAPTTSRSSSLERTSPVREELHRAVENALSAHAAWARMDWYHRVAVFVKAATLLSGVRRTRNIAAVMLNHSKNPYEAEIDPAELVDFRNFNAYFTRQIYEVQPNQSRARPTGSTSARSRASCSPITPFNFTSIAGNLPTAPAADRQRGGVEAGAVARPLSATTSCSPARGGRPAARRDQPGDRARAKRSHGACSTTPTWPASTSPAPPPPSSTCGSTVGAEHRRSTGTTRGWSARPAARTSSSRTRRPTPAARRSASSAAPSSTRARSARPPPAPTSRARSGRS